MRVLMKVSFDTEAASKAIQDGSMADLIQNHLPKLQPEAVYSGSEDGRRTSWIFFDLAEPSDLPRLTEPFFMQMKADVVVIPVMTMEDVQTGLQRLAV